MYPEISICFFGFASAAILAIEATAINPFCRNKFADCECAHLDRCGWYVPPTDLELEFKYLKQHVRRHSGDKDVIKQVDLLEQIMPAPPRPPFQPRGLAWNNRLQRARRCNRICKHHSKCWKVRHIPTTIYTPAPRDGRAWEWDAERKCFVSDGTQHFPEEIPNPAFHAVAYALSKDSSSQSPQGGD